MNVDAIVYVVDDDPAILRALIRLLQSEGYTTQAFSSPREFLAQHDPAMPGCLVLDICMPHLSGLMLQQALLAADCERFIVFITGHGDIAASVQAMKSGAVDFLTKPFHDDDLLNAIRNAVAKDEKARHMRHELALIRQRMATLTPREHEVLQHVVAGRLNKQIAADLGTAEKTIKVHRARAMEKMGVASLAELVRMTVEIDVGISQAHSQDAMCESVRQSEERSRVREHRLNPH